MHPPFSTLPPTRRHVLAGAGAAAIALVLPRPLRAAVEAGEIAADGFRVLRARGGSARLRGEAEKPTSIWGYDGVVPGPTLRVRRGQELKVRLINELSQATAVHWHGLRLPNAMDGVPHLTQPPIEPGQSFDYRFVAKDAGTFWYHSHLLSSEQLARGLYGVLIVEEPEPLDVDRDVMLVVDDWRLTEDGEIHPSFGNMHDAAHAGRLGQYVTINSQDSLDLPVRTNERLRLRLLNAANARVFTLRFPRHAPRVMAIDGQPAEPYLARDAQVTLGPGNRIDLFLDATLEPDARAPIVFDAGRAGQLELGHFVYDKGPPVRPAPKADARPLPDNPLPARMDFAGALKLDVPLDGGAMSMMLMRNMREGRETPGHGLDPRRRLWTLADLASSGHDGPPLFTVKRGRTVMLAFANRTAFAHSMHVHGHHFRLLDRLDDGWKPYWLDTVTVDVEKTERIAFVADNPGKWMLHCHMIEHQDTGMAAWFEVT
jgi:FtsP/CotA-like multicopper oxidase with cupredoxin domain